MEASKVQIHPVSSSEDIVTTAKLAAEIWKQHYTPIIGAAQVTYMLDKFQSIDVMTQQISEGYLYYLLRGNSQLGYLCIKEEEEQSLFISKIYLKANQRGNGYGKQMMEFAMKKALELNLSQLRLTVNKYNSKTIAAYERMGFIKKREVVFDIGNGYVMDDYEMVLKL